LRVPTTDESASLRGTALHLLEHKLGCLPVVSDGKLAGIITDSGFVTVAINLIEQLELSEPEEVLFEED
jgi:CBS domain-containing membrane protein